MPELRLSLAGVPTLALGSSAPVPLAAPDGLLLAWLALRGATPRERLAALLWPDSPPEAARNALRQRLFRLRRLQGAELVGGGATLALAAGVQHDLAEADTLLEGLESPVGGEIERWLRDERQARRAQARARREARIAALEAQGEFDAALPLALALLEQEPLSEDAHRRVMRLHYLRGDRAAALLAFDHCAQLLKDEVGSAPSAETLALLRLFSEAMPQTQRTVAPTGTSSAPGASSPAVAPAPPPALPRRGGQLPLTLLRPPRLVGREAELQALQRGWVAGTPVRVQGDAGIGKSRLLHTLVADDPSLASAAGRPGDALVPYATLARLLQGLVQRLGAALAPATRRALAPLLPMLDGAAASATGLRRGSLLGPAQALLEQVAAPTGAEHAAAPGPGAVAGLVLDDLHFADTASLELLQALLTGPRGQGAALRWCLGHRPPQPGTALAALVAALDSAGPSTVIVLRPLDEAALAELVESLHLPGIGQPEARQWAPLLRQRSGGNPLYALETLKAGWNEGRLSATGLSATGLGSAPGAAPDALPWPRPPSLDQLIAQQLARLSPVALALARLAAVAGVDFSLPLAEVVLAQPALVLADPWHELEAQQVFADDGHFAHDLIFEAVLAGVPTAIARHLHGQVARFLEQAAAAGAAGAGERVPARSDPARIAVHWERAGEPARALPHLRAAAERAHLALREHERIAFLLRAADIAEARGELDAAFASVASALGSHINTIRDAGGLALLERLQGLARTPAQHAEAAGLRAWYAVQLADLPAAVAQGRHALALAEALDDPMPALMIRQRLATALAAQGEFDAALRQFDTALQTLGRPGVQLADAEQAELHGNHAAVLDNLGRGEAAATQRRLAVAAAVRAGDSAQQVTQLANQAVSQHAAGHLADMLETLAQAERLIASYEMSGSTVGFVAVLRCQAERACGRFAAALAAADVAERELRASNPARLPALQLQRGHVWLDLGQPARALQALQEAAAAPGRGGGPTARLPPHLEARRCLLMARAAVSEAHAWRARAAAALPASGWPEIALLVPLEHTLAMADAEALPRLAELWQQARTLGLAGVRRAVLLRLMERWLAPPDPAIGHPEGGARGPLAAEGASPELDAAVLATALAQLAEPLPGDGSTAALAYALELPWASARLLAARGLQAEARTLGRRLTAWVQQCRAEQVAEPFRAGFDQRNPVNRALAAADWLQG